MTTTLARAGLDELEVDASALIDLLDAVDDTVVTDAVRSWAAAAIDRVVDEPLE